MRKDVSGVVLMAAACLMGLSGCNQPTKFEQSSFADSASIAKQSGDYWKKDGWWGGLKPAQKKVVITEFSVEYVTREVSKSGADTLSILGAAELMGMGKRERKFDETFMAELPTDLYAAFVSGLTKEGFEVVPMDTVIHHPAFEKIASGKTGEQSNLFGRKGFAIYPVKGLPAVDDTWFNATGNYESEAHILGELGGDVLMRVHMRVGLDDSGRVVMFGGSTVRVRTDVKTTPKQGGGTQYYANSAGAIVSKAAMRDDVPVITKKEFEAFKGDVYTIESAKYKESLMKMYPAFAQMAAVKLKS